MASCMFTLQNFQVLLFVAYKFKNGTIILQYLVYWGNMLNVSIDKLENILLSEIRQTRKDNIVWFHLYR